jgi:hypothetical protein
MTMAVAVSESAETKKDLPRNSPRFWAAFTLSGDWR